MSVDYTAGAALHFENDAVAGGYVSRVDFVAALRRAHAAGLREAASQRKLHTTTEELADWCDDRAEEVERA